MKCIIICGGDRLGKNSLIESLAKYYTYDNVCLRHLGKPPKTFENEETPLQFQIKCFEKEGYLIENFSQLEKDQYTYYENILIYNRFIYGEYVYGQMFRNQDPKRIESYIKNFEERYLLSIPETYLVLLTADAEFFFEKEDGFSYSKTLSQKEHELKLFDDIFNKSLLDKKLRIKVNHGSSYVHKEYIYNKVLELINKQS